MKSPRSFSGLLAARNVSDTWADPEGAGGPDPPSPGKSQMAIGFIKNSGTDPLEMQIAPRWRSVRPSACADPEFLARGGPNLKTFF